MEDIKFERGLRQITNYLNHILYEGDKDILLVINNAVEKKQIDLDSFFYFVFYYKSESLAIFLIRNDLAPNILDKEKFFADFWKLAMVNDNPKLEREYQLWNNIGLRDRLFFKTKSLGDNLKKSYDVLRIEQEYMNLMRDIPEAKNKQNMAKKF